MKKVLLLGYLREKSTRVENKMTRPFGNTTLCDIYLDKLEKIYLQKNPFSGVTMAIGRGDKIIWDKATRYMIPISERSDYSIGASISNDCKKVFHYLENFDEEYVMWINACFPFLQKETILKAVNYFINSDLNGLHCVRKRYNWFWDYEKKTLLNPENIGKISTVHFIPTLESVHCFHIYKREYLLENNSYWKFHKDDPYLYEVNDSTEFMDIDTQEEFELCEYISMKKK